ncbi:MAG: S24/S26 family peptidase [Candidatus Gastranaerophilales bacterium]|nr:S24/S26 family peptidase [Candidatus Gastranaerophilales bacterium]
MQDIEQLLTEGRSVRFFPQGYSMYPLFVPGRDEAIVAPVRADELRRGDVALYRRDGSILVLHRIWKREGERFYLVGDNQKEIEGPLRPDQMKGVLVEIIRKGRHFSVDHFWYRAASGIWLFLRPLRPVISRFAAGCKRVVRRMTKIFNGIL